MNYDFLGDNEDVRFRDKKLTILGVGLGTKRNLVDTSTKFIYNYSLLRKNREGDYKIEDSISKPKKKYENLIHKIRMLYTKEDSIKIQFDNLKKLIEVK